jgi:hypothetical protein
VDVITANYQKDITVLFLIAEPVPGFVVGQYF